MSIYKNSDIGFLKVSFYEFLSYMLTWILAYAYIIRVGAIDWGEEAELENPSLEELEAA